MMDDEEHGTSTLSNSIDLGTEESSHDEVQEIRKLSRKDTTRIRLWRIVVTLCLLAMAAAITYTTYQKLRLDQEENFQEAVSCKLSWRERFMANATAHSLVHSLIPSITLILRDSPTHNSMNSSLVRWSMVLLHNRRIFVMGTNHLRIQFLLLLSLKTPSGRSSPCQSTTFKDRIS